MRGECLLSRSLHASFLGTYIPNFLLTTFPEASVLKHLFSSPKKVPMSSWPTYLVPLLRKRWPSSSKSFPRITKLRLRHVSSVPCLYVKLTNKIQVSDVSKEADVKALVDHLDAWGGVDIMFNNAGIMHADDADAVDTPEKIWDLTQAINVKGVWFGSKHAVLSLRKHKKTKGSIINTASVVALVGSATPQLAYTASKGAVLAMTRELAIVHAREGFRFNALCPAPLNTPLLQDWLGDDQPKRHRREVHFPSGRFGEAIEQARAVLFLASDDASYINGQVYHLPNQRSLIKKRC